MAEIKLKPCPFCGGAAKMVYEEPFFAVICIWDNHCEVGPGTAYFDTPEEAAEVWNRRADNG